MRLIFVILASLFFLSPALAHTEGKADCKGEWCECWRRGDCGHVRNPHTNCVVTIVAPSLAGKVTLDIRRAGKSVFDDGPRITHVDKGLYETRVGCHWIRKADEVYLCIQTADGHEYNWALFREDGSLDEPLKGKRLRLWLLGPDSPGYIGGKRPPRGH